MVNTNRYRGLLYLKGVGLPVPSFQKISDINNINEDFALDDAPFGWTIRTCKKDGIREFKLFYKNYISFSELKEILNERLRKFSDEFYIIYHSWDFDYSLNIVKDGNKYIVEGDLGSQKEISTGASSPKFSIIVSSINLMIQQSFLDRPSDKIIKGIFCALKLLQNSIYKEKYYTEVAITKQKQMFFL